MIAIFESDFTLIHCYHIVLNYILYHIICRCNIIGILINSNFYLLIWIDFCLIFLLYAFVINIIQQNWKIHGFKFVCNSYYSLGLLAALAMLGLQNLFSRAITSPIACSLNNILIHEPIMNCFGLIENLSFISHSNVMRNPIYNDKQCYVNYHEF